MVSGEPPLAIMKKTFIHILVGIVMALLVWFAVCGDYYIWRLQHPQAPTWTFFFSK